MDGLNSFVSLTLNRLQYGMFSFWIRVHALLHQVPNISQPPNQNTDQPKQFELGSWEMIIAPLIPYYLSTSVNLQYIRMPIFPAEETYIYMNKGADIV